MWTNLNEPACCPRLMKDPLHPKPERLKLLLALLREQDYLTSTQISEACSSSPKTAQRDIDTLRNTGKWPIESSYKGFSLRAGSSAEKHSTKDEHFAVLMIAGCSIDKNIGQLMPSVADHLKSELHGLSEIEESVGLPIVERAISVPSSIYSQEQLQVFGFLARNIIDELSVSFEYINVSQTVASVREVFPVQLKLKEGIWYLLTWDLQRDDLRVFKINKIGNLQVFKKHWTKPSQNSVDEVLRAGEFSIWDRNEDQTEVRLKVEGHAEEFVVYQKLTATQEIQPEEKFSIVIIQTSDLLGLKNWCRRFASEVEILAPQDLRESHAAELTLAANKNS